MSYAGVHLDPNQMLSTSVIAQDPLEIIKQKIKEKMTYVLSMAVYDYKRVMIDWINRYVPRDTGRLAMGMMNIVDSSGAVTGDPWSANFRLGAPAPYAGYVNQMPPTTQWGNSDSPNPNTNAKTYFFDEAYQFANMLIKNLIIKHIKLTDIAKKLNITAEQFYGQFFGATPLLH